jgi:acyl carrier protein
MENITVDITTEKLVIILQRHIKFVNFVNNEQAFPLDTPFDELGLDSLSAIDLLLDLEESFDIVFPDSMLNEETFRTAKTLHKAVSSLMNGQDN